ncbi:MAG TPA: hypothetical protein DHV30_04335 [Balneola sp.]|nr:hypothetical protein [Balneola sp.]|tara:strand:+ start:25 stop:579 length:555 start_codon:yes stop_codon:yes gene_type:complete
MATVYEIVQCLSQAAANAYDGALDENGEPIKAGLQREEGDPILDKRVMDGFGVKFFGNMMCLNYMSEVQLKEVYANGFEADVEQRMADIVTFLKKEYRKICGESITLTKDGEIDVRVENSSRVRSWVTAKLHYRIGGLDEEMAVSAEADTKPEANWEKFISQGGWTGDGGKRPDNDTRPKSSND